jgi:hypothetical protein
MQFSFKLFFEDDIHGKSKKGKPENYLDGMWRELGIDPNSIPKYVESGPIEIKDEGLWYNQAVWEVIKPIDLNDSFVRLKFHKSLSPSLNQRCYVRREDGQMIPYEGDPSGRVHLVPMGTFAKMLGKPWQAVGAATNPLAGGL